MITCEGETTEQNKLKSKWKKEDETQKSSYTLNKKLFTPLRLLLIAKRNDLCRKECVRKADFEDEFE